MAFGSKTAMTLVWSILETFGFRLMLSF